MIFRTRKMIRPEHLNPRGTLFGGQVLKWIDEEAAIYVACQLETSNIVTKIVSEANFMSPARNGDIVEIGCQATYLGESSITVTVEVRNKTTKETIVKIDKMVFVHVGENGKSAPHGITQIKE
jgi:acyl-CoA hydrolase